MKTLSEHGRLGIAQQFDYSKFLLYSLIDNQCLVVKDAGFGEIVYSGTFIGNTLVVALANSGESYTVEFV